MRMFFKSFLLYYYMALKVFITGASSGLGESLAVEYSSRGAILGLVARRAKVLKKISKTLQCTNKVYSVDVKDYRALENAAKDFIKNFGVPDIVIANAGIGEPEESYNINSFKEVLDTNVIGMAATLQPFINAMKKKGRGTLVGISSISGIRGLPKSIAYSTSKSAVITYLESLRIELNGTGINVLTVCPGFIKTPMSETNSFKMPFIISAKSATRKIIKSVNRKQKFIVIPWQMKIVSFALKYMPNWIYDRLSSRVYNKIKWL